MTANQNQYTRPTKAESQGWRGFQGNLATNYTYHPNPGSYFTVEEIGVTCGTSYSNLAAWQEPGLKSRLTQMILMCCTE